MARFSIGKASLAPDATEIEGEISLVDAKPEWNGWGRATVHTATGDVAVVGSGVSRLIPGAKAKIFGKVKHDPRWGQQFEYADSELSLPDSRVGYVRWLAARVPHVGPVLSGRLWDAFGDKIWDVVDQTPDLVLEVKGIGEQVRDSLIESYVEWLADVELYTQLSAYGFPEWLLIAIQKKWKREAVAVVQDDPYRIYYEIHGAGFQIVDRAALKAGIEKGDPRRLSAAVEQSCREGESQGHTYMLVDDLQRELAKLLLAADDDLVDDAIEAAVHRDRAIYFFDEGVVQRSRLGRAERDIAFFVARRPVVDEVDVVALEEAEADINDEDDECPQSAWESEA